MRSSVFVAFIYLIIVRTFHDIINKNVKLALRIVDKNSIVLHNFFMIPICLMKTAPLKV
jgi:hypothetical protein